MDPSNRYPNAQIISLEADPQTYDILKNNTDHQSGDWTSIHAAAGSQEGKTVHLSDEGPSMSHRIAEHGQISISTISLASLIKRLSDKRDEKVDLVKIDIEGSEEDFSLPKP